MNINDIINKPEFQSAFETCRDKELRKIISEVPPKQIKKVLKTGKGGKNLDLSKFSLPIQTALVRAYACALDNYYRKH